MSEVHRIDGEAWEGSQHLIPLGEEEEVGEWVDYLLDSGARWDRKGEETTWEEGHVVVVAVRHPGPEGRVTYYMVSTEEFKRTVRRVLRSRNGGRLDRLGRIAGRLLGPVAENWREAWSRTFVTPGDVAAYTGVSPDRVEEWRKDRSFPLPVMERNPGPLYVREDVELWLKEQGLPEL